MSQRILFHSGSSSYLLSDPTDASQEMGQVLDLSQKALFSPFPIGSILVQGYWEPYLGSQAILPSLLSQVKLQTDDAESKGDHY